MNRARALPASVALALHQAAAHVERCGWARPLDDDETTLSIDGRVTLAGALSLATGVPVAHWTDLASEDLRPVWDALVLALADLTGEWAQPRSGLEAIDRVLCWERSAVSCAEDVALLLRAAAIVAEAATEHAPCPVCAIDAWRSNDCRCCGGTEILQLHPLRWRRAHLRLVVM